MLRRVGLLATEMCTRGGVQSFMLRLAEVLGGIAQEGEATQGYCFSLNDSTKELIDHPAVPAHLTAWGAGRSKAIFLAHSLAAVPRTQVILVGHLGLAPVAYSLKRLGMLDRYYVILHGIEAWQRVSFLKRQALLRATRIIATTRYTAEECGRENGIPSDRFHIIPLCADERAFTPTPGFRLNGEFKLLCVARQAESERYKGFEQLFQALRGLLPDHPGIHLNLVGNGNDKARLRRVAESLGLRDHITFWGSLSDEELAAAYEDCDVYAMPSKKEGFGITFLEAMRRGKPCIGGNHGGTPDVIEHGRTGYLVDYDDLAQLSRSIRALAENPDLRAAIGSRGQRSLTERFTAERFRSNWGALIAS